MFATQSFEARSSGRERRWAAMEAMLKRRRLRANQEEGAAW
jgi:hypothetical protein